MRQSFLLSILIIAGCSSVPKDLSTSCWNEMYASKVLTSLTTVRNTMKGTTSLPVLIEQTCLKKKVSAGRKLHHIGEQTQR